MPYEDQFLASAAALVSIRSVTEVWLTDGRWAWVVTAQAATINMTATQITTLMVCLLDEGPLQARLSRQGKIKHPARRVVKAPHRPTDRPAGLNVGGRSNARGKMSGTILRTRRRFALAGAALALVAGGGAWLAWRARHPPLVYTSRGFGGYVTSDGDGPLSVSECAARRSACAIASTAASAIASPIASMPIAWK